MYVADPEVSSAQPDNNVSGNSGYITSPNYPEDYPNKEDYEVTVTLDQAGPQTVELTLDDFDVERCTNCDCDNVLINGDGSNRLCGVKNGQKISVDVAGDTFTVTLHTDFSEVKRGFNISYNVEQGESGC
ncbi:adhesion G-protein coupled receptor G6-like [Littorina saxatilis]|uniref:adhesion G-protein coupled receptor G6-like n=1 Tax=Littorina saxatilis TaxID=31220 RepID=UPI0038B59C68